MRSFRRLFVLVALGLLWGLDTASGQETCDLRRQSSRGRERECVYACSAGETRLMVPAGTSCSERITREPRRTYEFKSPGAAAGDAIAESLRRQAADERANAESAAFRDRMAAAAERDRAASAQPVPASDESRMAAIMKAMIDALFDLQRRVTALETKAEPK